MYVNNGWPFIPAIMQLLQTAVLIKTEVSTQTREKRTIKKKMSDERDSLQF